MLVVPFMKNKQNLEFYSLLVPFIFFHWSVNDDSCALTQMEMAVTGNKKEETFFWTRCRTYIQNGRYICE